MTYKEQIQDPRWQKVRLEIMNRDGFICTNKFCTSLKNTTLNVHHLDYIPDTMIWEYPTYMLVTLCYPCHHKEQSRKRHEKFLLNTFKMHGFLVDDLLALSSKLETDKRFRNSMFKILREMQEY